MSESVKSIHERYAKLDDLSKVQFLTESTDVLAEMMDDYESPYFPLWKTANEDVHLTDASKWTMGTWNKPEQNPPNQTMFPSMNFKESYAFTRLGMKSGFDNWNSCAVCQNMPIKVSLDTPQQVISRVMPLCEKVTEQTKFDIFVEYWCPFTEPTGINGLEMGEVMIVQRMVTSDDVPKMEDWSYWTAIVDLGGGNAWYNITFKAPDIPFMKWSKRTFDLNTLLFSKLNEFFGCDLSKGYVGAINIGVEGFSPDGSIECVWDTVNHQYKSA